MIDKIVPYIDVHDDFATIIVNIKFYSLFLKKTETFAFRRKSYLQCL